MRFTLDRLIADVNVDWSLAILALRALLIFFRFHQNLKQILSMEVGELLNHFWELGIGLDQLFDDGARKDRDGGLSVLKQIQNPFDEGFIARTVPTNDRRIETD